MNEGVSFDSCYGHPDGSGKYHNHMNINCTYNATDSTKHSPLIGFILDSYPVYGPFGYSSANNSASSIKRMTSGFSLRNITTRTTFQYPFGNNSAATSAGPPVTYLQFFFVK